VIEEGERGNSLAAAVAYVSSIFANGATRASGARPLRALSVSAPAYGGPQTSLAQRERRLRLQLCG